MAFSAVTSNMFGMMAAGFVNVNTGSFNMADLQASIVRQKMRELGMPPITICQLGLEVSEIESIVTASANQLGDYCNILDAMPAFAKRNTIAQIDRAMREVAVTAAKLQTVDLESDEGLQSMYSALENCEKLFQAATGTAQDRLKTMSDIHAQIVEVQNAKLIPLRGRLDGVRGAFAAGMEGNIANYKNNKEQLQHQQQTMDNLQGAVNSLQQKIRDDESASQASDIGFDILTLGIYHAVNGHAPDPAGLHDEINRKRQSLQDAQRTRDHTADIQMILTYQMGQIRQQSMYMLEICGRIPRMLEHIQSVVETSLNAQRELVDLKANASDLVKQTQNMKNSTQNAKDLSVLREEFVDGLNTICDLANIDPKLGPAIQAARDAIKTKQVGPLLKETQLTYSQATDQYNDKRKKAVGPLGIPAIIRSAQSWDQGINGRLNDLYNGSLGVPVVYRQAVTA